MPVPTRLSDWTLEVVQELVENEYHEDDFFDWKEVLTSKDPKHREQVVKAACSLANTRGGFLVFGVAETGNGLERIKGIPHSRENAKQVADVLKVAEPSLRFDIQNPPIHLGDGTVLLVVELQRGEQPHQDGQGRFWRRSQGTAVRMTYEIENGFTNYAEKRARVQLVFLSLVDNWIRFKELASRESLDSQVSAYVPDMSQIRQHLGDVNALCPEAVTPLLHILQVSDVITFRTSALMPALSAPLTNRNQLMGEYNRAVTENVRNAQKDFA